MTETDVVTKLSPLTVADTTSKLTGMIAAKGMKLFGVIDQAAEAREVGLTLRDTVLVIFGSPVAGTPVSGVAADRARPAAQGADLVRQGTDQGLLLRADRARRPAPPWPGAGGQPGRDQRADRRSRGLEPWARW